MLAIERATSKDLLRDADDLAAILTEAVAEGAGLGFLAPVAPAEARAFVEDCARDVDAGARVVLVARLDGAVVGSAQLALCLRPNGTHRAECQKAMVATRARRHGVGRALMRAVSDAARAERRTLLYLDTFADQHARRFYEACGWTHAGDIPDFARTNDGALGATSFYYKRL